MALPRSLRPSAARSSFRLALVLGLGVSGPGCVSLKNVRAFASATEGVAANTASALQQVNGVALERCLYGAVSAHPREAVLIKHIAPDEDNPRCTPVRYDQIQQRLAVIESIAAYAEALGELAATDPKEGLEDASVKLNRSLLALNSRVSTAFGKPAVDERALGAISSAVYAVGAITNRIKRARRLREVIQKADEPIQNAVALLQTEFNGKEGDSLADYTEQSLLTMQQDLITYYNACSPYPPYPHSDAGQAAYQELLAEANRTGAPPHCVRDGMGHAERIELLQAAHELGLRSKEVRGLFQRVGTAMGRIGKTHATLAEAVAQRDFSMESLEAGLNELQEVADEVEALQARLNAARSSTPSRQ